MANTTPKQYDHTVLQAAYKLNPNLRIFRLDGRYWRYVVPPNAYEWGDVKPPELWIPTYKYAVTDYRCNLRNALKSTLVRS